MARANRAQRAAATAPQSGTSSSSDKHVYYPIVGIGASAGGVEAFKELIGALPRGAGMAYVLLLHLPARHESFLSEILARDSQLPVVEVINPTPIEMDRVYVLPAGSDIDVRDGTLILTSRSARSGQHRPIDHFFHSLAERHGDRAIGVVLSGTGSDGALGIQEIKAAGGITFAQDDSAQQRSMPQSAIQTGAVDFVLRPADIAHELARIAAHPILTSPTEDELADALQIEPVLELLRESSGVDFSQYKRNTLRRRILRRLVLHKVDTIPEYVQVLRDNPSEAEALYHDVLINVTSFFRNPEAFDALKEDVFPTLTENRSRHDPVRIWTLGCSTGEEAYSLAIAFAEFAEGLRRSVPVQVFATDLNSASIDKARLGIYPASALAGVSEERRRRFFVQLDGSHRIAKPIRDACIFARHNVLEDPPFSRIDLVSCRNMLIYLDAELQQKVIPILHYALRPRGWLWLGTSETIGNYRELFELRNTRYKIYVKRDAMTNIPVTTTARATAALPGMPAYLPAREQRPPDVNKEIDRLLVLRYAPPSVLIRADLEILQYRGDTTRYLTPAPGRATLNLLRMLREGLTLGVRSAIERAKAEESPVRHEGLVCIADGVERRVNIEVLPVKSGVERADMFMVLFEDADRTPSSPVGELSRSPAAPEEPDQEIARLKQELSATREYLQSVIEQQEAANEELQSANEEVQSANEELQSINEELETSKEEVRSTNEELATVNDELHGRNTELAQINNDLVNLLAGVQMPIIMLGPNLRIRRFTPAAEKLLNLIPTDVGRPVSDIKTNLDVPNLDKLVAEAVDSVAERELEVQDRQGRWYLLRIRPYRTLENKIDGAVMLLIDVDSLKRSQEMLRQQTELLDQAYEPIVMWELDGDVSYWNKAAEDTYGFTRDQAFGRKIHELLLASPAYGNYRYELQTQGHWTGEVVHTRRDGQKIIVESRMVVVTDTGDRKLVVQADRPITERKEFERVLRRRADDLVAADRNKDEFLAMLGHELRTPLAPVRNVVSILRSEAASRAEKARALDILDRQISTMERLVDDLLDVSRITLSQIELRKSCIDLVQLVHDVVEQNMTYFVAREQRLRVNVPPRPVHIDADPVRFEQILANLLHNASKYTQRGGEVSIAVEERAMLRDAAADASVPMGEVVIRIKDNGIGIAADKLSDIFDMFMRATRSIDPEQGGLGLGLTLVKRLVELHGGRIEAQSDGLGHGSEFIVRVPSAGPGAAAASSRYDAPEAPRDLLRIAVVDDNVDVRESLEAILKLAGHEVRSAESAERAVELAREFRPDVFLIDLSLPGTDGYQLAERLRNDPASEAAMLVAVSGYAHEEARARARRAGFQAYMVKPASIDDINEVLAMRARNGEGSAASRAEPAAPT